MTLDNIFDSPKVYEFTVWKGRCSVCGKLFYSCIEEPKHCNEVPEVAFGVEKTIRIKA